MKKRGKRASRRRGCQKGKRGALTKRGETCLASLEEREWKGKRGSCTFQRILLATGDASPESRRRKQGGKRWTRGTSGGDLLKAKEGRGRGLFLTLFFTCRFEGETTIVTLRN